MFLKWFYKYWALKFDYDKLKKDYDNLLDIVDVDFYEIKEVNDE